MANGMQMQARDAALVQLRGSVQGGSVVQGFSRNRQTRHTLSSEGLAVAAAGRIYHRRQMQGVNAALINPSNSRTSTTPAAMASEPFRFINCCTLFGATWPACPLPAGADEPELGPGLDGSSIVC